MTATLLSASEVAEWLGLTEHWVREHSRGNRRPVLPAIRIGKRWRYDREQVIAWLKEMQVQTQDEVRAKGRAAA